MRLYAVTYTDPSEPWGAAVLDRKLYRTPTELVDALNAAFDSFLAGDETRAGCEGGGARYALREYPENFRGMTELDAMADEFGRIFGVGAYELVGVPEGALT